MNLFPNNGGFVRLRNRERDKYVHADEDGTSVSLRPPGAVPSLNEVWKVDIVPAQGGGGGHFLLLQGAAYGRYLGVAGDDDPAPPSGHRGVRALQRDFNELNLDPALAWRVVRVVEAGQDTNYVRLHNNYYRCLRANGKHRQWKNLVTVDFRNGDETKMMQWGVEIIPSTPDPLPLPPPPPEQPPMQGRHGLFRRRTGQNVHPNAGRTIRYARLDDEGNFVSEEWPEFVFYGHSVSELRTQVANREQNENITLSVRAGWNALVIPLVANLPNNEDRMDIIVYNTGSPAAAELTYPQF